MRSDETPGMSKRRIGFATALLALTMAAVVAPSHAATFKTLTPAGSLGALRLKGSVQMKDGTTNDLHADLYRPQTDQNRTVGDAGIGAACSTDCARYLLPNDPSINPSATDGHTHYHAGDRYLLVSDAYGFLNGDTLSVGSSACDFETLTLMCRRYRSGIGIVNEQPTGENAGLLALTGGTDSTAHAPGVFQLAQPLTNSHAEGEQVAKLETHFPAQQMRATVPNTAVWDGAPVNVHAWLIEPQGSRDASAIRYPLETSRRSKSFSRAVGGPTGTSDFYVPRELMYTLTVGPGYSIATTDTWYTLVMDATDADGIVRARGYFRFKLNPIQVVNFKPDHDPVLATTQVRVGGLLADGGNPASLDRPAQDIMLDMKIKKPVGTKSYKMHSCADVDPGPRDVCGTGDVFLAHPAEHGAFYATIGGTHCSDERDTSYVAAVPDLRLPDASMVQSYRSCAVGASSSFQDTQIQGTYTATAVVRYLVPVVQGTTQFHVTPLTPVGP